MQTASKKVINGWAMYDWANSVYNLVITSTIFPAYYTAITLTKEGSKVSFFGHTIENSVLLDYTLAAAYLIIALISPVLSSIADYSGNKKKFMQFFCYVGALSCCALFMLTPSMNAAFEPTGFSPFVLEAGMLFFMLAAVGYCGSQVFYNAYLPEIAAEPDQDRVSAKGFAYGYIGSVLLQIVCFIIVMKPQLFFIPADPQYKYFPARISFVLVGLWWLGFAQIPFKRLPLSAPSTVARNGSVIKHGFQELQKVWKQLQGLPVLKRFLRSFFFYSMGVQTVMLAAAIFGSKTLHLPTDILILTTLIIQIVAIAGAWLMSKLSGRFGNLSVLAVVILIWVGICIGAYYTEAENNMQFFILGGSVGLVMGGIQSLSRSTYAKLMPETKDTASFFSFYDVTEKLAIVIGMTSFGFIEQITGNNMRNSVLALGLYFIIAFILMLFAIGKLKQEKKAAIQ
ncbi:MFS transporter, UMF1 family [Filimonas lacunae]|uniref:MFS transporter, UMF1 family n=1 Tax=Filimonas lacunae TaxID=477680 RepID=A0A173MP19_9BACT|nr:MFS transporter [Filimonas lacunae]BAV09141.1 permease, major facilitator superfamily [Filimonas lacunae]SIS67880.1 MFS transporter, UMF1 family [Filimonas lacunae]